MPLVNSPTSNPLANARSRVNSAPSPLQGGAAAAQGEASDRPQAKPGPAVVVHISDAARFLSLGVSNPAVNDLSKPGLNNGTMAAEGGAAAELRGRLTQRYAIEEARIRSPQAE